ncbi:hypothetical protein C8J57DRAFT_1374913 [Mycena rebaudengoi]|nr:hypothetical protein C8J57DRAFT_1374913 [Mycena rebaudengoi]
MKQVGQLFDETLAAIRDNAPGIDALEPEAIAWLKSARYEIMRGIESAYYEVDRSLNPSSSLFLTTGPVPTLLYPYGNVFRDNLATLIQDCGFSKSSVSNNMTFISVRIYFPVLQRVAAEQPPAAPRVLHVEDEFSRMGGEVAQGGFSATAFGRLLTDARREDSEENDNEGPRLRSMTHASSVATLRSSPGNLRRSGRKRVKTEE